MVDDLRISNKLRSRIHSELKPGESIRWVEQPIPHFFTVASIGSVLFGIPWTSFAIFWMWGASGGKLFDLSEGIQAQHLFSLFGLPFVLIGFGMLSSPLWMWQAARQTVYLITNKRAISIQRIGSNTTIRSYSPAQLQEVYRRERDDGTGDVIISIRRWKDNEGNKRSEEIGFMSIRDPQDVEHKLKQLA